jgi:hypothetical protein
MLTVVTEHEAYGPAGAELVHRMRFPETGSWVTVACSDRLRDERYER